MHCQKWMKGNQFTGTENFFGKGEKKCNGDKYNTKTIMVIHKIAVLFDINQEAGMPISNFVF